MADRYWVGGSADWTTTFTTAPWSATSGGPGGASAPTSADNVFFDQAATYTVNISGSEGIVNCLNITVSAGTVTFTNSGAINVYGSLSFAAGTTTWNNSGSINFLSTTTGRTVTTNGTSLGSSPVFFNGAGGGWTLGSAFTSSQAIYVQSGTFDTGNFAVSCSAFSSSGSSTRTVTLGSSTLTLSSSITPVDFTTTTNLTFNAGTSLINCTGGVSNFTFQGGGRTFYDVSFTNTSIAFTLTINGVNTFRNLTFASRASTGVTVILFGGNQTINGTFTPGNSGNPTRRTNFISSARAVTRTLTCAAIATASDVDFRDITISGAASPMSGTRLGDATGNSGITFPAAKTVYWNLTGANNWYADGWATSSGGAPNINNFPLAQDTAVFDNASTATSITVTAGTGSSNGWNVGTVDMSARTNALTLSFTVSNNSTLIYGNWINGSGTSFTGTSTWPVFNGNSLQTITNAGKTWSTRIVVFCSSAGTVRLLDALTTSNLVNLGSGTFDSNGYSVSTASVSTSGTSTRTIAFGGSTWTLTGTAGWDASTATGLTFTGTGTVSMTAATAKTFTGGGASYTNMTLDQGGAGALTITGTNTFGNITNTYAATGATTITLGSNQTVAAFSAGGQATRLLTLNSSAIGTQRTLAYSGAGTITAGDYLSVRDIAFTPAPATNGTTAYRWYLGANSENAGNNSGGLFIAGGTFTVYQITSTATTTWTVPSGWSGSNTIHLIGGGGGGGGSRAISSSSKVGGAGGGGGGYRVLTNYSTTTGSVISVAIGTGGTAGSAGGGTGGTGGTTSWAGNIATGGTGGYRALVGIYFCRLGTYGFLKTGLRRTTVNINPRKHWQNYKELSVP